MKIIILRNYDFCARQDHAIKWSTVDNDDDDGEHGVQVIKNNEMGTLRRNCHSFHLGR